MSNVVLVGADPEVFVSHAGKIISAIGIVPGSKAQPVPTKHGFVQPDNVLAEFNINPAKCRNEFVASIKAVLADLGEMTPGLDMRASHMYTYEELDSFGPEAFIFGCDPDFDAWRGGDKTIQPVGADPRLRTAGGHVHLGYLSDGQECSIADRCRVVRAMDVTLGLQSVLFDKDTQRKQLYGKAGCFRPKKYGVEYRTLSNFWLMSDELMAWAYEGAVTALVRVDEISTMLDAGLGEMVRDAINTSDTAAAKRLIKTFRV